MVVLLFAIFGVLKLLSGVLQTLVLEIKEKLTVAKGGRKNIL